MIDATGVVVVNKDMSIWTTSWVDDDNGPKELFVVDGYMHSDHSVVATDMIVFNGKRCLGACITKRRELLMAFMSIVGQHPQEPESRRNFKMKSAFAQSSTKDLIVRHHDPPQDYVLKISASALIPIGSLSRDIDLLEQRVVLTPVRCRYNSPTYIIGKSANELTATFRLVRAAMQELDIVAGLANTHETRSRRGAWAMLSTPVFAKDLVFAFLDEDEKDEEDEGTEELVAVCSFTNGRWKIKRKVAGTTMPTRIKELVGTINAREMSITIADLVMD